MGKPPIVERLLDEIEPDAADWFGRHKATPEVIARANAEWEASDWRGRLPEGWTYEGASNDPRIPYRHGGCPGCVHGG